MKTTILNLKFKQYLLAIIFILIAIPNNYAQNSYDGNYCPGPGVSGDEYATGVVFSQVINAGASTTCAINTVYAKVNTSTTDLRVGIKIGNSGAALFRMYIDSDNNPTTGLTTDSFGGSIAVAGAEFILELNAKPNSTYTLYQATGSSTKVVVTGSLFNASNGNSLGCSASDGAFLEFYIPFGAIGIDICNPNNPGVINIAKLASVKGGSPTSDLCSDIPLTFGIPLKGSVGPSSSVCSGTNSSNLIASGLTGSASVTKWQYSVSPFTTWTDIANTTTSYTATNLNQTTKYRAVILNTGLCANTFNTNEATITVHSNPMVTLASKFDVNCYGGATGSINITASSGVSPYTYAWTGAGVSTSSEDQTGLAAGLYKIIVTDINSCASEELSVTITEPATALVAAIGTPTNVSCFGGNNGAATASATGGTTAYSYSWNTSPIQTTATATGLIAGTYIVTVTDDKGCTDTETVTITEPAAPAAPLSGGDNIKCKNKITQTLTATASVNPDEYVEWYDSATNGSIVGFPTLNSVDTVTYYAQTVTNTNSCPSLTRTPVTLTIYSCAIVAQDDAGTSVNGYTGGTAFSNVLANDTLNGVAVIPSEVTTTFVSTTNVGVTLSGTNVIVAAGTPAGSYTLTYQICEVLNPSNCDTAIVTLIVTAAIVAQNDTITDVDGTIGNTNAGNVLSNNGNGNDTLNGNNVSMEQVNLTIVTPATSINNAPIPVVSTTTGQISVPPGTAAGTYTIVYQICEGSNQSNCDSATVTIEVAVVLGCESIVVHNAFSPNGDEKNAVFVIDNIEQTACYPENTVEIYNRWGVLVFETKNYNNTTNVFDGTSRGRTTISQSTGLPTGTYYYILNYTFYDGNNNIQTNKKDGYLYLTR